MNKTLNKSIKRLAIGFALFLLIILLAYWYRHDTDYVILRKAQKEITKNKENYLDLYAYLSNSMDSNYKESDLVYRLGWDSVGVSLYRKDSEKHFLIKAPASLESLAYANFEVGVSFIRDYKIMVTNLSYDNYKLLHTCLAYSPTQSASINYLLSNGYKCYDSTIKKTDCEKYFYKIDTSWMLVFYPSGGGILGG